MNTNTTKTIVTGLLVSTGFAFAQAAYTGRCGQEGSICGNECDGSGFMNQNRAQGDGHGLHRGNRGNRGNRDDSGKGNPQHQRRSDGSGPTCNQDTWSRPNLFHNLCPARDKDCGTPPKQRGNPSVTAFSHSTSKLLLAS